MPEPAADMRSLEGAVLQGRYVLTKLIGEGSFGAVFKSQQQFIGVPIRRVAVKVSRLTGLEVGTARDLFADAFTLAAAFDELRDAPARNHLVHVYDAGITDDDGRGFVVMEYIEGTTLQDQFRSFARVPAAQLLKWVRQICVALRGLHALPTPLVHRDLKPDNVLLGVDLSVRVVDFGLAARLIAHGFVPGVAGTVDYMAPETAKGVSYPSSDVYSLGLILYEGLTGQLPFAHLCPPLDLPAALHQDWLYDTKRSVRAVPPSRRSNTSTPALDAIVLRCLAFEPFERYRHAGELLEAIDAMDSGSLPLSQMALMDGRRLRGEGDLAGARRALKRGLASQPEGKQVRFELLRELAHTLAALGEPLLATDPLVKAWELADDSGLLRTRAERAELLNELARLFAGGGNAYQAERYDARARAEKEGGRVVQRP